jgi:hypothetical protein
MDGNASALFGFNGFSYETQYLKWMKAHVKSLIGFRLLAPKSM